MWSCVGDFLILTFIENISFTDNAFGNRLLDCSKLAVNGKNNNDVAIYRHDVMVKFFWRYFVCLVNFSYWSKFHVNIITDSGVMVISFHKGLTRNPEIGNIPVSVLPYIWRLGKVRDTKFDMNACYERLLNAANSQELQLRLFLSY